MAQEKKECCNKHHHGWKSGGEAVYFFGIVGAAVYFIQHAATFWLGVLGFLKAIVWPALLIYKLLEFLKM